MERLLESTKPKKVMGERLIIGEVRDEKELQELFSSMKSGSGAYVDHREILLKTLTEGLGYTEEEKEKVREVLDNLKDFSRIYVR